MAVAVKRFWREVATSPDGGVTLDGRPLRTPGRVPLILPNAALVAAVADEWRAVGDTLDPRAMPLTGIANAGVDRVTPDPATFAAGLARYGESDLLCYRAEAPDELIERQRAAWDSPLDWARQRYDVAFETIAGVVHRAQPEATLRRLREATRALSPWMLAAASPIVTLTGSLVLCLALIEGAIDPEAVWHAAHVDEDWQAEQWGVDPLAVDARETRRREFTAATRFLSLLGD